MKHTVHCRSSETGLSPFFFFEAFIFNATKRVQVSLDIRGGYVPEKSQTANNKTGILGPNYANLD